MIKIIIILLFLSFYLPANSSSKDKIISQMKLTNNLSFNFIQKINDKSEDGKCIIEYRADLFSEKCNVGNIYINRDMVGAVVGSQPFGGQGLSGSGYKAGGPNYLITVCE